MLQFFLTFLIFLGQGYALYDLKPHTGAIKDILKQGMETWTIPGFALGIVQGDEIVLQEGFGIADIETKEPVTSETVFALASTTKNIFAHLVAMLVQEGKFHYDDPASEGLPGFSIMGDGGKLTLRDMMGHRCGLEHFSGDSFWWNGFSATDVQSQMMQLPPEYPFRDRYTYQNMIFGLGSLWVQNMMKQDIGLLFQTKIFDPLGMKTASTNWESMHRTWRDQIRAFWGKKKPPVARGHHLIEGRPVAIPALQQMYLFPGTSGVNASLSDMIAWMKFLVKSGSFPELFENGVPAKDLKPDDLHFPQPSVKDVTYGMGWFSYNYEGLRVLTHMGGVAGWRSLIIFIPERKMGIIMMSNLGGMRVNMFPEALRCSLLDLFLDRPLSNWSQIFWDRMKDSRERYYTKMDAEKRKSPRKTAPLSTYCGIFKNDLYGEIRIENEKNHLVLIFHDRRIPLTAWNGDVFNFTAHDLSPFYSGYDRGRIEFGVEEGIAKRCFIHQLYEGKDPIFTRS